MNELDQYLDSRFVYSFWQGPEDVRSVAQALKDGINCISLAHLAINSLFGYNLPKELHCSELFTDTIYFDEVDSLTDMELGDVVWFGLEDPPLEVDDYIPEYKNDGLVNWQEFPVKHAGIYNGESDNDDPYILHSTSIGGTNVVWPLSKFSQYRRYRKLYGIRRLRDEYKYKYPCGASRIISWSVETD